MVAGVAMGEDGDDGGRGERAAVRAAWAEVWTRAEAAEADALARMRARAWAQTGVTGVNAKRAARVDALEAMAQAEAEALALAGAWAWARRGEAPEPERVISGLALVDSSTIRDILSDHHRYGLAPDLWHHSRQTRDEYSCLIDFIAPITRLPFELLRHIFLIVIDGTSSPPLVLMLVCEHWHTIVTTIWAPLNLGTRTPIDTVTKKLERNERLLDIVLDTDSDRGDFTPSDGAIEAIFAAIEARSQWRSLVVESFPAQADLPEDLVNSGLQRCPNATMSHFTTFKIKSPCEASPLLHGLLRILGTTASTELTTVEINSPDAISFLAPTYPSIFHSVKVLSLDYPGMPSPVDLLPLLPQLETLTASHIFFPIYHNDVDLPFIYTLRHLTLRAVSIQWMSGRTFHVLEDCTLIFPLHRRVLHTFSITLPNCKHFTFQGSPLNILNRISVPILTHLSVACPGSFNGRGNQRLLQLSRHVLGESRLAPTTLHIGIEATNQAWMNALIFMSDLEELVIDCARPSSLGAKLFQSLIVQPDHVGKPSTVYTPRESRAPLCPLLKRFGLKYRRWLRLSEDFNLIPDFVSVIGSRECSNYSLQSFSIWMASTEKDPLELIEQSRISRKGLRRLAFESGTKGELLETITTGLYFWRTI